MKTRSLLTYVFASGLLPLILSCDDDPTEPPPEVSSWKVQRPSGGILSLYDVSGIPGSDVFAVGSASTVFRYRGGSWSPVDIGTGGPVYSAWGSAASDVYLIHQQVGFVDIIHYDGGDWNPSTSVDLFTGQGGLWGSSNSDVFAVGLFPDSVLHFDGDKWIGEFSGTANLLADVWGSSATNVYAVGAGGTIVHYDGGNWSEMTSATDKDLKGIWGSSDDDIYAVGVDGAVILYDGGDWNSRDIGTTADLNGVWSSSKNDVYIVGFQGNGTVFHYNGTDWTPVFDAQEIFHSVWGSSASDVFVVGSGGLIVHYGQH